VSVERIDTEMSNSKWFKITRRLGGSTRVVCLMLLCTVPVLGGQATTYQEKIKQTRSALVEVVVSGARRGTGFCVSEDGYVVTAIHVIGNVTLTNGVLTLASLDNISVRFDDGATAAAKITPNPAPDWLLHDIAVLKVDAKTPHFLKLAKPANVTQGDEVYTIGFPFDAPGPVAYRGNVSAVFQIPTGVSFNQNSVLNSTIHVQIPVAKGFSGSPLLRMSDDSVVGVVTNKLGGINPKLEEVRKSITASQGQGKVLLMGVDPNQATLELINVLDQYLSAGAGWASSIEYVEPLVVTLSTNSH